MPESIRLLCAVCSDPVDPDADAHPLHSCGKRHGTDPNAMCSCDRVAHPDCCPELECQDIGTGFTIELVGRFSVPPWFTEDQANALAQLLTTYLESADLPLADDYGPSPVLWYGYDSAYICAAVAGARVVAQAGVARRAVIWGHGDRCRACHHLTDAHNTETRRCAVDECACSRWLPYGRLADIGEAQP